MSQFDIDEKHLISDVVGGGHLTTSDPLIRTTVLAEQGMNGVVHDVGDKIHVQQNALTLRSLCACGMHVGQFIDDGKESSRGFWKHYLDQIHYMCI